MRFFDFSSWQGALVTLLGIALVALIGVGIRVLVMLTIQQRQQRINRQINERLKTLMAAYRTLGGSFTGNLTVNPAHLRDLREEPGEGPTDVGVAAAPVWERPRQIRDAVEAALADILLLGNEEQVRLAGQAARDMAAGLPIHTAELVIALRTYIRMALDLDAIPDTVVIPHQGPTRPQGGGSRGERGDAKRGNADGQAGRSGGAGGGPGGGVGMGVAGGRAEDSSATGP